MRFPTPNITSLQDGLKKDSRTYTPLLDKAEVSTKDYKGINRRPLKLKRHALLDKARGDYEKLMKASTDARSQ